MRHQNRLQPVLRNRRPGGPWLFISWPGFIDYARDTASKTNTAGQHSVQCTQSRYILVVGTLCVDYTLLFSSRSESPNLSAQNLFV